MSPKSKMLLVTGLILAFSGATVFGAALLTWTRTITWNIPATKGFDVYACTESNGVWSLTTSPPTEIPSGGSIDLSNMPSGLENYWIANTGNAQVSVQLTSTGNMGQSSGATITWTFEYDSLTGANNGFQHNGGGWQLQCNLMPGEYIVIQLSITDAYGQGSYSFSFLGS